MTPEFLRLASRMLNAFENDSGSPETDYKSIYLYHDGPGGKLQVTLGRGFTQFGGALGKVVRRYVAKGGLRYKILPFFESLERSTELAKSQEFMLRLRDAHDERAMRDAQDEIFQEVYLQPALKWAADRGFVLPLSNAVIIDSFLHSGTMLDFLMKRFPEMKPSAGGDEKAWSKAYVRTRKAWLLSKGKPLSNTTYRQSFFEAQMRHNNWQFDPKIYPLIANGSNIA